ncbi:hypothetical protein [Brevibacillus nitrificans]|uniref:hypothetical protein n=1 Tax=Brevibacillus nitrificans TaxID=651560 RepID=UPI00285FC530|nr:ABC-type polar amino acid transport system ATPase subunit [Brevibacillus nitrificans]
MVFQNFNLFEHKTALGNVIEGPTIVRKMKKDQATQRAMELFKKVGLEGKENQYPHELSGGHEAACGGRDDDDYLHA